MTTLVKLTDTWQPIDTKAADVLVTPQFNSGFVLELYMGGANTPNVADVGHVLKQPFLLPKGVGAHVRGVGHVHVSAFATS